MLVAITAVHDRPENQHGGHDRSAPTRPKLSLCPLVGPLGTRGDISGSEGAGTTRSSVDPRGLGGQRGVDPRGGIPSERAASALLPGGAGCGGSRRLGREGEAVRGPPEERTPQFKLSGDAAAQRTRAPTATGPRAWVGVSGAPGAQLALGAREPPRGDLIHRGLRCGPDAGCDTLNGARPSGEERRGKREEKPEETQHTWIPKGEK
ncbi:hypothetical protein NDU88_004337 [Pleurodeles waltl]|uniref:Uncharacterized protein n=1 Tax=Pleurodeles waltl TaxID=8319 RepID=A0AAV7NP17_PLEWA|nr:hypothetical protein NDU88_004337 [Pleurodeles waltl]